ncbi:hypothetical protein HPB51_026727 [Rhipicephalus microplus]|uniref:Uncharacterized protein n=1 Tax=Rhipicephalus microplus TaxID=6941 RepID=A0A9J6D274_RHIMP|nr:hypothetical protein HPB51_026727 [Rhipicephalus microplus]
MARLLPRTARRQLRPLAMPRFFRTTTTKTLSPTTSRCLRRHSMPGSHRLFCLGPRCLRPPPRRRPSVDEDAVVPYEPDEVPEQPVSDNATLQMPPDHTRLLNDKASLLRSLLRDLPSVESWAQCEAAWTRAVALAVVAVRLPPDVLPTTLLSGVEELAGEPADHQTTRPSSSSYEYCSPAEEELPGLTAGRVIGSPPPPSPEAMTPRRVDQHSGSTYGPQEEGVDTAGSESAWVLAEMTAELWALSWLPVS